ncbi:unnamed protein product [Rotaria socialis]|uniref:MULE transposase domain-containing protein n=8 Tax=Rotaria socialis TaxID=392032 RepID=A0A820SU03_9BILA|nr:unnamed protein product [Rotaria socialis]CAF4456258.1 unnamed protein product [Rotaria socialis]
MISNVPSENSSFNAQQPEISFATSNKGNPLIICDNYLFRCNKTTISKKYWICTEKGCSVYIHTNVNKELISISGNHNHSANPDQLEAKILRDKMKERILTETTPITKIYDEEIVKAKLSKAAAVILPTVIEYRSNMSKARRKITPVIPSSVIFDIPESYQQTLSNERFLLVDLFMTRGKDRILVFSSDQQLELLFESETIFMDGTFDTTPPNFKQVYLIHAQKFGQGLPVAFCLLPNKRGKTYTELIEQLKEKANTMGKQFKPKRIITDYEPTLLPVVGQEFPTAVHSGCMFHFNQAIHRKITDLGLANDYLHNGSIRDQCRQLMALSLMPITEIDNQFQRLQTIMATSLSDLLVYFQHQWMHGVVPMHMWNFHHVKHRTNNTSEGKNSLIFNLPHLEALSRIIRILAYNLRFATRLARKHPNIWSFIQLIKSEHVRFQHISIQLDAGASAPKQSKKTTAFQMKVNVLHDRFLKKEITTKELLSGLSLLIGNKKK